MKGRHNPSRLAQPKFPLDILSPSPPSTPMSLNPKGLSISHSLRGLWEQILGEGRVVLSELNLAGWEGLILHDHGAAARQDQNVQLLLLLMSLLVPLTSHLRVVSRDQSYLGGRQDMPEVRM